MSVGWFDATWQGERSARGAGEGGAGLERSSLAVTLMDGAGAPFAGVATVRLFSRDARGRYGLLAEREVSGGKLTLEVPHGEHFVVARALGRARAARAVTLERPSLLTLELPPARALGVEVVVDGEGGVVPLPGATVLAGASGELPHGARTNAEGRVRFDALGAGAIEVDVVAPGYEPYRATTETDLLVRLRPVRLLRVKVEDGGKPVPDAEIFVSGAALWPARTVRTTKSGQIDISGLRAGRYSLAARAGQRVAPPTEVDLRAERGVEEVTLRLGPGFSLEVRVVDEEKAPVAAARLTFSAHGLSPFSTFAVTDARGVAHLGPLLEGAGTVQAAADGFVARVVDATLPGPLELELMRAGEVRGRVVDARGRPIAGAVVEVVGTDTFGQPVLVDGRSSLVAEAHFEWSLSRPSIVIPAGELGVMLGPVPPIPLDGPKTAALGSLTSDDKGRFSVPGVPPGRLVVLARHPDYLDGKSRIITLERGATAEVEVVLGEGVPLAGRVVDHRGFPVTDARVRVTGGSYERQIAVESDGTFEFLARPPSARLSVSAARDPLRVLIERKIGEADDDVELVVPAPREDATLVVKDEAGEPLALAGVRLTSLDEQFPWTATRFSDDAGATTFPMAVGLRVRLVVDGPGHVPKKLELVLPASREVRLERSHIAEGRVLGVRGRLPAAGARVRFEVGDVVREVVTDEFGQYVVAGLARGALRIEGEHAEYGQKTARVNFAPSAPPAKNALPDLVLEPRVVIRGRAVDEAGRPVARARLALERLGAYVKNERSAGIVGQASDAGEFEVEVEASGTFYVFGMRPGLGFGFSDAIVRGDRDRVDDVTVVFDRKDELAPDVRATVLVGLEAGQRGIELYSVEAESQARLAGLREGDVLISVDDEAPRDVNHARELLSGAVGSDVHLTVRRGGGERRVVTSRETFLR